MELSLHFPAFALSENWERNLIPFSQGGPEGQIKTTIWNFLKRIITSYLLFQSIFDLLRAPCDFLHGIVLFRNPKFNITIFVHVLALANQCKINVK